MIAFSTGHMEYVRVHGMLCYFEVHTAGGCLLTMHRCGIDRQDEGCGIPFIGFVTM